MLHRAIDTAKIATAEDTVRKLISEAIARSGLKRDEIARRMEIALNQHVSEHMLNAFTSRALVADAYGKPKQKLRFPVAWLPVFAEVVGDECLIRSLLPPRLRSLLELGEHIAAAHDVWREIDSLRAKLSHRFTPAKEDASK